MHLTRFDKNQSWRNWFHAQLMHEFVNGIASGSDLQPRPFASGTRPDRRRWPVRRKAPAAAHGNTCKECIG
jgi:hypothetical protein